jgi:esterase
VAVDLAFTETGSGEPLVILPGLFGSKRNWTAIARSLAEGHRVLTVDLRNHGDSPWHALHDYPSMAEDVAALIGSQLDQPPSVIGHSMGGKVAMTLALVRPELVSRLVAVDIAPARSTADTMTVLRAMQQVPLAACSTRSEVKAALAEAVPSAGVRDFLALNLTSTADGLAWGINLAALADNFEAILGFPAFPAGRVFDGPTLFLAGGRSTYIRTEHEPEIRRLFPRAVIERIPEAGHWVHAEAPRAFLEIVSRFLAPRTSRTR